jgi:hypothetical protein
MIWSYAWKIIKIPLKHSDINPFRKVARYKINTQQSVTFLYLNNEQSEKDIKKTIPFTIASEN